MLDTPRGVVSGDLSPLCSSRGLWTGGMPRVPAPASLCRLPGGVVSNSHYYAFPCRLAGLPARRLVDSSVCAKVLAHSPDAELVSCRRRDLQKQYLRIPPMPFISFYIVYISLLILIPRESFPFSLFRLFSRWPRALRAYTNIPRCRAGFPRAQNNAIKLLSPHFL